MLRRALIAGLLLVSALAAPAAATPSSPYGSAAVNRARARRSASRLLAELRLPDGSRRTAREPRGSHRRLSLPGYDEATPNLTDAHGWWTSRRSPAAVLAYLGHRLPPHARLAGTAGGSDGVRVRDWSLPAVPGLGQRILAASVVATSSGTTAVRLDGEAVWLTPRPRWEQIPAAVGSASFAGHGQTPTGRAGRVSRRRELGETAARRLARYINSLPVVQPGVTGCPARIDESTIVRFDGPGGRPLASAIESPTGCPSIALVIGARTGRPLVDGDASVSLGDELVRLHAISTCPGDGLRATARLAGSMLTFTLGNRSAAICELRGTPRLALTTTGGRILAEHAPADRHAGQPAILYPGSQARFGVDYTTCPARSPATAARVTPAGIPAPLAVRLPHPLRPCATPLRVGVLAGAVP